MRIKEKSKIIGWDDSPFEINQEEMVPLVGAITRGGTRLEGLLKTEIEVDGLNGTGRIASAVNESKHRKNLSLIMLDGITFGGLNVVDIEELAERTGIPVMAVTRKRVDIESFRAALKNLPDFEKRWEAVKTAGEIKEIEIRGSKIFYQKASLTREVAEKAISTTAINSSLPEPLRLADMIAGIISSDES